MRFRNGHPGSTSAALVRWDAERRRSARSDAKRAISNMTLRLRYYGFCCWLSDAYARRGVTTDFEIWRPWVRRDEALFALVCADGTGHCGGRQVAAFPARWDKSTPTTSMASTSGWLPAIVDQ